MKVKSKTAGKVNIGSNRGGHQSRSIFSMGLSESNGSDSWLKYTKNILIFETA